MEAGKGVALHGSHQTVPWRTCSTPQVPGHGASQVLEPGLRAAARCGAAQGDGSVPQNGHSWGWQVLVVCSEKARCHEGYHVLTKWLVRRETKGTSTHIKAILSQWGQTATNIVPVLGRLDGQEKMYVHVPMPAIFLRVGLKEYRLLMPSLCQISWQRGRGAPCTHLAGCEDLSPGFVFAKPWLKSPQGPLK